MINWILFGKICFGLVPAILIMILLLYLLTNIKNNDDMTKRVYRLKSDRKIAGVCSGLAEYFNIDPTIVRLGWLIAVFCWGGGLIAYLIAMIVIPEKPDQV